MKFMPRIQAQLPINSIYWVLRVFKSFFLTESQFERSSTFLLKTFPKLEKTCEVQAKSNQKERTKKWPLKQKKAKRFSFNLFVFYSFVCNCLLARHLNTYNCVIVLDLWQSKSKNNKRKLLQIIT